MVGIVITRQSPAAYTADESKKISYVVMEYSFADTFAIVGRINWKKIVGPPLVIYN